VGQTISKSSMLGIIFGLGIVIVFIIVMLMLGQNNVAELSKPSDIAQQSAKVIYDKACATCHTTGMLNAPKLGDKTDWEPRIIKGEAILLQNAINGFNIMPPRGGAYLSDEDMQLVLQYMLSSIEFKTSPEVPLKDLKPKLSEAVTIEIPKVITQTPVAEAKSQPLKVTSPSASGKSVYDRVCMACHNTGILNAPKLGDKADWAARIEKGEATLIKNSINGFNTMPPRGGNFVNDADMQLAVQYMLASVGFETSPEPVKVVEITPNPVKPVEPKSEPIITKPKVLETTKEIPKAVTIPKMPEIPKEVIKTSKLVSSTPIATSPKQGKDIYDATCKSCHIVGIAGAPKVTEKKDWEQRLAKGEEILVQSAINGLNIMPPKGGNANLTDEEVKLAVQYMLKIIKVR